MICDSNPISTSSFQVTPHNALHPYDSTSLIPPRPVPPCSHFALPSSHPTLGLKFFWMWSFLRFALATWSLACYINCYVNPWPFFIGLAVFRLGRQFLPRQKDAGSCAERSQTKTLTKSTMDLAHPTTNHNKSQQITAIYRDISNNPSHHVYIAQFEIPIPIMSPAIAHHFWLSLTVSSYCMSSFYSST